MGIIATLAGISFAAYRGILIGARQKQTVVLIQNISESMDKRWADGILYTSESGNGAETYPFPNDSNGGETSSAVLLIALRNKYEFENNGGIHYMPDVDSQKNQKYLKTIQGKTVMLDGFGNPLNYKFNQTSGKGEKNNFLGGFDLWSNGPDGINNDGKGDDITNW